MQMYWLLLMLLCKRLFFLVVFISVNISFFSSMAIADETNEQLKTSDDISQQINRLENIVNSQQALSLSSSLLKRSDLSARQKIAILTVQESHHSQLNEYSLSLATAKRIQVIAAQAGLKKAEAAAYKSMGISHYYKSEHQQALAAYQKSLSYYIKADEPLKSASLYNNIALIYAVLGDVRKTLINYQYAETIYQEKGTERDKVDVRLNIAGLYLRLKRFDLAIELYLDVIENYKDLNDEKGLASARGYLGSVYKYSGEYQQALSLLLQAIKYFEKSNEQYELASFSNNVSGLYNMMSQPKSALKYASQAVRLAKTMDHNDAYAGGLYNMAQAQFSLGYIEKALENLQISDELARKMEHQDMLTNNLALMALIYSAQNKQGAAFKTHQEYIKRTRKIANNDLNVLISDFESIKLKQENNQLKQNEKLQQLQTEKSQQQRTFSIIAAAFLIVLALFVFSRNIDKRSKLKLSERVKNRTKELELLTNELVKANAIKSQFLANMSHEMRTPLTSIIGQAEAIINEDIDDECLTDEVEVIHANSLHLLELINNILDLSKVEANKLELELVEQDLQGILHDLANMFTKPAEIKGIQFNIIHTLPASFLFKIDSLRLKQILINLCSNAIKFTNKGKVTLDVSIKGDALTFAVRDTGIGMSETQLQEVFASFTQGDSSISRRFGGSGLGLCLSEQLAKLMNGKISVISTLNQGSTFTLILPCQYLNTTERVDVSPTCIVASPVNTLNDENIFTGQIVLADDHDDNRRLIARLLTSLGLEVLCASNGREAVELSLDSNPKLILMDIQMPEMDGLEAFKVLRQKGCLLPIVALTANAMSHETDKYLALGFDGHLKKPIDRKLFIATIAKYYGEQVDNDAANHAITSVDMSDLVIEFKSNLALEQQDMILHIKNNELKKLAELAHRIAGAAQMFGFSLVSTSAIQLEKHIKNGSSELVNESAQNLLNEIDQVLW